ncbi:hypothetical protein D3C79_928810 [compost metagenome]
MIAQLQGDLAGDAGGMHGAHGHRVEDRPGHDARQPVIQRPDHDVHGVARATGHAVVTMVEQ